MSSYRTAPIITPGDVPSTSKLAKPTMWEPVTGATVLKVASGRYRQAVFSDTFLVNEAATEKHKHSKDGWRIAIVECMWFGRRLKTQDGIQLKYKVEGSEIIRGYTGGVVCNLSK